MIMSQVKKILFPTDFSPTAQNAFKHCLILADYYQAKIEVLHVVFPEYAAMDVPVVSMTTTREKVDAAVPVMMSNFADYAALYASATDRGTALIRLEQERFRCDHAVAGWLLARSWGLPPKIAAAIRYHHDPELYILPESELPSDALALIAVTLIAEHVLAEFTKDADLVGGRPFDDARTFLGTSEADLDEFRDIIASALS